MVNDVLEFIYTFETGCGGQQSFFNQLLKASLKYKYESSDQSIASVSQKDLTDAIFGISAKDKMVLLGKEVNGQKLNELFIASIYLDHLDRANPDKTIVIAIPFREESYDVAIYVVEKDGIEEIEKGKCKFTKPLTAYKIQIKEEFDFRASQNNFSDLKESVDIASLEKKASKYDELVLIFMRDYALYKSSDTQSFLKENKNVGLILMPSLDPKEIKITNEKGEENIIPLEEGKFNFLLNIEDYTIHVKYNVPAFLIRKD